MRPSHGISRDGVGKGRKYPSVNCSLDGSSHRFTQRHRRCKGVALAAEKLELQLFVERHHVGNEFVCPLPITCIQRNDEIMGQLASRATTNPDEAGAPSSATEIFHELPWEHLTGKGAAKPAKPDDQSK